MNEDITQRLLLLPNYLGNLPVRSGFKLSKFGPNPDSFVIFIVVCLKN